MVQSLDDARRRNRAGQGTYGGSSPASGGAVGRVPPHNLQAEESLLGAMLLSRDAIAAAVETCSADDFYKPAHGHVFDAVCSLYAQGEPADPVTVADELRRADLLDAIGGPATLITLQANTPATTNAARYARIVEEHALLRRLIGVAGEIAEMSYGVPEDVSEAVDRAETLVFEVAERRVTDSLRPLHDLLSESLDRLEALYDRGESITGVPTGFIDLDERLSGLQPSSLIIVGARPSMGKALSLDTPLPTPTGWTTMGDLCVGDVILDERGAPCSVTFATPVMRGRPCYRVTFDDGCRLVADADHQWFAYHLAGGRGSSRVVTTRQMVDEGVRVGATRRPNWSVQVAAALDLPAQDLPLDPYLLGVGLGGATPRIATTQEGRERPPEDLVAAGRARVAVDSAASGRAASGGAASGRAASGGAASGGAEPGLQIPERYLRASRRQRRALLQGLMDTAATATRCDGTVEVCLSDPILVCQVRELVCSLGHKAGPIGVTTISQPGGLSCAWVFSWSPLDPRHQRHDDGRSIVSIEPTSSVPVRCITVDSPNHLYLAGDSMIPTHNTAIALGMASHAAMEARTPVLFFSLEMSHSEVTQRLLCSEARVDSTRVRNGKLLESDWPKISHAIGRLGEAPLFIDDNPNLTVMEIRAKARRLRSRLGNLGLIVVDYLQLMSGRHSAENRQVEVSEISRGLKILARELSVPVVALSQLSRNLEMRADKRPVLADLRESGCMPASTRLLRADNGQEIALGELVLTQQQPVVWSVDDGQRIVAAKVLKAFPSGIKPVFTLTLASGRSVAASANHRFLTIDGWGRLDSLAPGDLVAVARRLPPPVDAGHGWNDDEVILLAHLIGAGTMRPPFVSMTADGANLQLVGEAARRRFGVEMTADKTGAAWQLSFPSPYALIHGRRHPMWNWLEPLGLLGARAGDRFVPPAVFGVEDTQVALILRQLWATRGSIAITAGPEGPTVRTEFTTPSRRLALDVQRLLLRLGVTSQVHGSKRRHAGAGGYGGANGEIFRVQVHSVAAQAHFLRTVGCHDQRRECIPEALGILDGTGETPNVDPTPSDLYWDEVVEITAAGRQPTFDVTVEGTHNFFANDIVAHNSLEQDADVVMFLYRDEVYNPESPDRGTAEVIISKHRNGPTGITHLAFLDHYTRFANMARV